ncbi:hypothetical protein DPMN_138405 [Dreissena polymorpha]|uniref:HP domain-containing protein n=1 Tax=Dreissena polymorpha TaxID=45954 RepID=A0A9D4G3V6_DREPO|nr:hypothetical protein DPMN_138405 [Dreissena polymorpha]
MFHVLKGGQGVVMIGNETFVECSSHADITFKFNSHVENESFLIGECDALFRRCRILAPDIENTHTISHTGRGGILHINHTGNDTYGTYECFETYFPSNKVTVDVNHRYIDGGDANSISCERNEEKETDCSPIIAVSVVGITLVIVIFILQIYRMKDTLMTGSCRHTSYPVQETQTPDMILMKTESSVRALHIVIEKTEKALHDLRTGEESISLGDSHKTLANVTTSVEKITKRLTMINEELDTLGRAHSETEILIPESSLHETNSKKQVLEMTKEEFYAMPAWKQSKLKQQACLF